MFMFRKMMKADDTGKAVVFSQWTSFLNLVQVRPRLNTAYL